MSHEELKQNIRQVWRELDPGQADEVESLLNEAINAQLLEPKTRDLLLMAYCSVAEHHGRTHATCYRSLPGEFDRGECISPALKQLQLLHRIAKRKDVPIDALERIKENIATSLTLLQKMPPKDKGLDRVFKQYQSGEMAASETARKAVRFLISLEKDE